MGKRITALFIGALCLAGGLAAQTPQPILKGMIKLSIVKYHFYFAIPESLAKCLLSVLRTNILFAY